MTLEAIKILKHIHHAFPEAYAVDYDAVGLRELRELGFVDLYDLGQKGEVRWTMTIEGRAALSRVLS